MNMHDVINASQKRSASILGAKKPHRAHDNDDNDDDAVDYNRTIRPLWPSRDDTALPLQNLCKADAKKSALYGMNWKRPSRRENGGIRWTQSTQEDRDHINFINLLALEADDGKGDHRQVAACKTQHLPHVARSFVRV